MSHPTILEMAANVRQQKAELDAKCRQLKAAGYDWTQFSIAGEEAMVIASDGLRNAWQTLQRLRDIACVMQTMAPNRIKETT